MQKNSGLLESTLLSQDVDEIPHERIDVRRRGVSTHAADEVCQLISQVFNQSVTGEDGDDRDGDTVSSTLLRQWDVRRGARQVDVRSGC